MVFALKKKTKSLGVGLSSIRRIVNKKLLQLSSLQGGGEPVKCKELSHMLWL